jgi:two-component system chemotaxis sensor kinase CheA
MSEMDDVVKEFLVESYENLDRLDRDLVELEKAPSDHEILSSIFRTIHTIKGTCGFLAFSKLESVAHVGESLLSRLRDGVLTLTPEITTALLEMVDAVRDMLASIESSGSEGERNDAALIETLTRLQSAKGAPAAKAAESAPATSPALSSGGPAKSKKDSASIYDRLGGAEAIKATVEKFYQRVLDDPQLQPFFANTDMDSLKAQQVRFFTQALGGPAEYKGRSMKEAHAPLAIEQRHFDLVAGHLMAALVSLSVPKPLMDDVVAVVAPLASEIVSAASEPPADRIGDILIEEGRTQPEEVAKAAQAQAEGDPRRMGEILVEQGAAQPREVLDALQTQASTRGAGAGVSESNIRVDVGLLDKLMNLVGELVLARNQILQFTVTHQEANFVATSQRLNLITTELQAGVMKTRMQPIGNVWNKFPRVVRDLATACGKKIRIEMEGKETELDKTIIEAIKDPLTHLVRNSADHGIEAPDKRKAAGKPAEGVVFLRAFHEGGQVNIEISDDGAGVDPERMKKKALQRGVITSEQAARMSEREAVNLIFLPGFSTAEKVTNVSGRGVGMDVVKTNVEKIGGTVDVQSKLGQGTTVKIKIPLTLAIIPALTVTSGGDRFAIPQVSLVELVHLEGEQAHKGIEMIHGAPVYRLRGNLLPLVNLGRELGMANQVSGAESKAGPSEDAVNILVHLEGEEARKGVEMIQGAPVYEVHGKLLPPVNLRREPGVEDKASASESEVGQNGEGVNIVILQADDRTFGLVVEGIHDTEEIVVKPLGRMLKGISTFAGATIMGDGKVALILDVLGIAQRANVVSGVRDRALMDSAEESQERSGDLQTFLVCEVGKDRRVAMPLSLVARLEEFEASKVETTGEQDVVQYRGEIMPLVRLSKVLHVEAAATDRSKETLQVVVYSDQGHSVGLVVEQILDIVEERVTVERRAKQVGILGSAVIQQRVTDLLDVQGIVSTVDSKSSERPVAAGVSA